SHGAASEKCRVESPFDLHKPCLRIAHNQIQLVTVEPYPPAPAAAIDGDIAKLSLLKTVAAPRTLTDHYHCLPIKDNSPGIPFLGHTKSQTTIALFRIVSTVPIAVQRESLD